MRPDAAGRSGAPDAPGRPSDLDAPGETGRSEETGAFREPATSVGRDRPDALDEPDESATSGHADERRTAGLPNAAAAAGRSARLDRFGAQVGAGLEPLWDRRWLAASGAVVPAMLWGMVGGWWLPRGPLTTGQALCSMIVSVLIGMVAGLASRSRWAMVAAPAAFALAYEVARLGTDGPLVDGPRASTYGLIALVVGRGVHGVLSLLPMALGAAVGAGTARAIRSTAARPNRGPGPGLDPGHWSRIGTAVRRGGTVIVALGLVAIGVMVARPARTDRVVDASGAPIPGGVAELTTVEINGHDLAMLIRGHSVENPVLLFLAGGPGGSELGAMCKHLEALEAHVTVVTWDQRGSGTSYPELEPVGTLTLDSAVADTLAVTDHLRQRFGQERIYLLGQSWGSTLGVLAVQAAPEKYAAFIGAGQMVSQRATDTIFYEDTLAWAETTGRSGLARELRRIGPPPYRSILDYETALAHEHDVYPYDHRPNAEGEGGFSENIFVEEYTLLEQLHLLAGFLDSFTVLYPQLQDIDFRRDATRLEVPLFFVQGRHEAAGRSELFEEWYPTIEAPSKDVTYLATSGHRPLFEQPDEFVAYVVDTVLATTQPG